MIIAFAEFHEIFFTSIFLFRNTLITHLSSQGIRISTILFTKQ